MCFTCIWLSFFTLCIYLKHPAFLLSWPDQLHSIAYSFMLLFPFLFTGYFFKTSLMFSDFGCWYTYYGMSLIKPFWAYLPGWLCSEGPVSNFHCFYLQKKYVDYCLSHFSSSLPKSSHNPFSNWMIEGKYYLRRETVPLDHCGYHMSLMFKVWYMFSVVYKFHAYCHKAVGGSAILFPTPRAQWHVGALNFLCFSLSWSYYYYSNDHMVKWFLKYYFIILSITRSA